MTDVFKICHLVDNKIKKMYVFIGNRIIENKELDVNALYISDPSNKIFDRVFSKGEIKHLGESEIIFVPQEIHIDDTIETIKKKYIVSTKPDIPTYSGLYMFTKSKSRILPEVAHKTLTQTGQLEITEERLTSYLLNIDNIDVKSLQRKDIYNYDDIILLGLDSTPEWVVSTPIGQKFVSAQDTYPFSVNPFNLTTFDDFLIEHADDIMATTNHELLLELPKPHNNVIYVCHIEDVMEYMTANTLSHENAISIYFPYLKKDDITSLADYNDKKETFLTETTRLIGDKSWAKNVDNTDMFYDISTSYKGSPLITQSGIKTAKISLKPDIVYNLPLDVVFKLINATKEVPFIKYNPSKRQEKIYRLHTDNTSTNGKKIPSLPKSLIFKMANTVAKNKEVAVYIDNGTDIVILSFFDDCRIEVFLEFIEPRTLLEVDDIITTHCNPVINVVAEYLQQSGYHMKLFKDIHERDVTVTDVTYVLKAKIQKKIVLNHIIKCLSSIFNVVDGDISKGANLRFKKVANYSEMDSREAFIIESLNAGARDLDIIKMLVANFNLKDENEARTNLVDVVSRQQIVQQAFKNRKLKIKNNPGFMTRMEMESFDPTLITTVIGINDIRYLDTITQYINAMLVLTQDPTKSVVSSKRVKDLCKGKKIDDEKLKDDLIAKVQEPTRGVQALFFKPSEDETQEQSNMLSMMLGDFDSDGDDESENDNSDSEERGGMMNDSEEEADDFASSITGMSLANPTPFSKKQTEREPSLFITADSGSFKAYSRSCQSVQRKQPVILTQEEKDRIDKEHPGSYNNSISYKSSETSPTYHYICPHYWSLKDNTSLTQEEVDSGKYGKVIPRNAQTVPEGANIYSFDSGLSVHRNKKGEYTETHPGFMKRELHPQGKCVPCCYKSWNSPSQIKLRKSCQADNTEATEKDDVKSSNDKFDEYVKGPEKFPLEPERIGYLPIKIQIFLGVDNKKCHISRKNTNIKKNTPCLVRIGVEKSEKQSFIAAISSIYSAIRDDAKKFIVPTISEMKIKMLDALNFELFTKLQNGNLVSVFDDDEDDFDLKDHRDTMYADSKLYKSIDKSNPDKVLVVKRSVRAYKNFRRYIESPASKIGHEYLWDLVCFSNPGLFNNGMNLIIIESKDDDVTGNVSVLCPSNHYSKEFFDFSKPTSILIKRDNFYEPIISYEDTNTKYIVNKLFNNTAIKQIPSLKKILYMIKSSLNNKCLPLQSRPKEYKFASNIPLEKVRPILDKKKFTIISQIINYNGKVIGLEIDKDKMTGMIPIFPSVAADDIEYKWLDDYQGIKYKDTIEFLRFAAHETGIPVEPKMKVVNDGILVGIITQTNQFVHINPPISDPVPDVHGKDLVVMNDTDYDSINNILLTNKGVDTDRMKYMKKLKIETGFFNTFRNLVRLTLGQHNYKDFRKNIELIISDDGMTYMNKVKDVEENLKKMLGSIVEFVDIPEDELNNMDNISVCLPLSKEKCSSKPFCLMRKGTCILMIPSKNLITDTDNVVMYYGRMADELVRYSRIQSFIFEPKSFLSFSNLKYNLKDDEVILLESLLKTGYFDELIPQTESDYAKHTTYDTADPIVTQPYSDMAHIEDYKASPPVLEEITVPSPKDEEVIYNIKIPKKEKCERVLPRTNDDKIASKAVQENWPVKWIQINPKRKQKNDKQPASWARYEQYKEAKTIKEAIELGATKDDINNDYACKYVEKIVVNKTEQMPLPKPAPESKKRITQKSKQEPKKGTRKNDSFATKAKQESLSIKWLQNNPKGEQTKSWERYERYKVAKTIEEALSLGAKKSDINYDYKHKYVEKID